MPEISIIVPVYKVEQYLPRCIDSILAQTFTDFELLLIDDGSPDNSGSICDEYATKDSRIRVFHKENGGVSSARNIGISNANGKIIMFADSDDDVSSKWCEDLAMPLLEYVGIDLTISSFSKIDSSGNKNKKEIKRELLGQKKKDVFWELHSTYLTPMLWNKAFRRDIIINNNIEFDTQMSHGEDLVFVMKYIRGCRGDFFVTDNTTYFYYYRQGSLVHSYIPNMWEVQKKCMCEVDDTLTYCGNTSIINTPLYCSNLIDSFSESISSELSTKNKKRVKDHLLVISEITTNEKYKLAIKKGAFRNYNKIYVFVLKTGSPKLIILFHQLLHLKNGSL